MARIEREAKINACQVAIKLIAGSYDIGLPSNPGTVSDINADYGSQTLDYFEAAHKVPAIPDL